MNNSEYKFRVLRITPNPMRGETVNVGLLVQPPSGQSFIRLKILRERLASIDPNLSLIDWDSWLESTSQMLEIIPASSIGQWAEKGMGAIFASDREGMFLASDIDDVNNQISDLLTRLVDRPKKSIRAPRLPGKQSSQLHAQMKRWFKSAHILSKNMDDISKNRIVQEFPVSVETDSYADFAFKNGALHIMETLDLRGVEQLTARHRNQAAFKSVVLDQAQDVTSGGGKRVAVVAASDYGATKAAIRLIERSADDLISMDSQADIDRLVGLIHSSLHMNQQLEPLKF